jgi:hypothetical protein
MSITRRPTNYFGRPGHEYAIDGEKAPGVTSIISAALPKPNIADWRSRTVAEWVAQRMPVVDGAFVPDSDGLLLDEVMRLARSVKKYLPPGNVIEVAKLLARLPDFDRDAAGNRGTEVHALAERYMRGEEVAIPAELSDHVFAFERFVREWAPTDELVEIVVCHRTLGYCGTFDMVCTLRDGRRWLLDLKTNRSGVFDDVALQLAGYRYAELAVIDGEEVPMPDVDCTGVVWLTPGGYELHRVDTGLPVWRAFQRLVHTAAFLKETKGTLTEQVTELERAALA